MALSKFKIKKGTNLEPQTALSNAAKGDLEVDDSSGRLYYHDGSSNDSLISASSTDVLTNKTIDGDDNTVQDLALSSLKAVPASSGNFLVRDGSGIVVDNTKAVPSGDVVGTSDSQVLTNKTFDADQNTLTNVDNDNIKVGASIDAAKIADGSVSNTEFQYLGNVSGDLQTQLNGKQATGNYITELTGDVTATGPGSVAATIASNSVTNAKLADMTQSTIKGRAVSAGTGDPTDLTATQATAILDVMVGDSGSGGTKGLVPAPATGDASRYLRGDATWQPVTLSPAYVGTNPEVGGSSPFQIDAANAKTQVINPAGAITVRLPSTSVLAGEIWTIQNRSVNLVSITSQDGDALYDINRGVISYVALQNTPTDATHWALVEVQDKVTGTIGSTGAFSAGGDYEISRTNNLVTFIITTSATHSNSSAPSTAAAFIPAKFCPSTASANALTNMNSSRVQRTTVSANGTLSYSYLDWTGAASNQTTTLLSSMSWTV